MIIFNKVSKDQLKGLSIYINSSEMVCINDQDSKKLKIIYNLLRGREKTDQGVIKYLNKGSYSTKPDRNLLGFVYQRNILLPDRTLQENLKYIMRVKDLNMVCHQSRIKRVLEIVDLKNYYCKRPEQLLKHQLLRANIAQAILNYPPVLVLEDPLIELDQVNSQGIIRLLKRLNKFSMTIVLLNSSTELILGKEVRVIRLDNIFPEKKKDYYG